MKYLLAAVAIGVFFRLYGLGVHSLWLDEGFTLHIATAESTLAALREGASPPLSFYLFRLVFALTDPADWTLRLVPALVSCGSLLLFVRVAAICIEDARARGAAVLLYAVSPFIVWYAQEVRTYAFLEFAGLLAFLSALRLRDAARSACLLGFLAAALGFGSHYLALMPVLASVAIAGCAVCYAHVTRFRALVYSGCVAAGLLVWAWWLISYLPDQLQSGWAPVANAGLGQILSLPVRLVLVQLRFLPPGLVYVGGIVVGAGVLCVLWDLARCAAGRKIDWRLAVLAIACLAPLLGTLAVSLVLQPRFMPRYLIAASAPLMLLMCRSASRVVPARVGLALAVVLIAVCVASNFALHAENLKDGYREACARVVEHLEPGDTVAVCTRMPDGFSEAPVKFYLGRQAGSVPLTNIESLEEFRAWLELHPRRAHLVVRWMSYSSPLIESLLSETRKLAESEIVENVQWILVTGEK